MIFLLTPPKEFSIPPKTLFNYLTNLPKCIRKNNNEIEKKM